MASFRDPQKHFSPIEVVERLLVLCHDADTRTAKLYLASDFDLALYLDGLGFDVYSRRQVVERRRTIDFHRLSTNVVPSGDRGHSRTTVH